MPARSILSHGIAYKPEYRICMSMMTLFCKDVNMYFDIIYINRNSCWYALSIKIGTSTFNESNAMAIDDRLTSIVTIIPYHRCGPRDIREASGISHNIAAFCKKRVFLLHEFVRIARENRVNSFARVQFSSTMKRIHRAERERHVCFKHTSAFSTSK